VLALHFRCPNGCTQGWGEDIPNVEVDGVGHVPRCLATEMTPTCAARFPFTKRLCPCVPTKRRANAAGVLSADAVKSRQDDDRPRQHAVIDNDAPGPGGGQKSSLDEQSSTSLVIVPSSQVGRSCMEVCSDYTPPGTPVGSDSLYGCYADAFPVVNDCQLLRKHFSCKICDVNWGPDIPNYVGDEADGNFGRCLITKDLGSTTCDGRHAHTKRLCPCHRKE
jgi:hypothetical protein